MYLPLALPGFGRSIGSSIAEGNSQDAGYQDAVTTNTVYVASDFYTFHLTWPLHSELLELMESQIHFGQEK